MRDFMVLKVWVFKELILGLEILDIMKMKNVRLVIKGVLGCLMIWNKDIIGIRKVVMLDIEVIL